MWSIGFARGFNLIVPGHKKNRPVRVGEQAGFLCGRLCAGGSGRKAAGLWFGHWRKRNGFGVGNRHGMQAFRALGNFEAYGLAGLECLVAVHLNGGKVGKKVDFVTVVIFAFLGLCVDKAEAFGIVEPLDLALHTHIPLLQTTPSLEYHPVLSHMNH